MAREWTKSQLAAITTQDADVLVSAAAGSGKTAVLVERIIQKITNETKPVDIDRLLVVTFTNAAAAEMRQRIADALNEQLYLHPENENLHRQLALLSGASITTIHGFCHSLLREHFALLDLDPTFKIADTTENDLLRVAVLDRVIEEMYEDPVYADSFLQLTEAYMQLKNQEGFYELVQSLFHFVMSLPSPEAWLLDATERFHIEEGQDFNETELAKDLVACGHDIIKSTLEKYGSMIQMLDNDDGQEKFKIHMELERNALAKLLEAETYDAFYEQINAFTFDRIPSSAKDSAPVYRALVQEMRDKIKNGDIKRLKIEMFPESGNEQLDMLCKLYPLMQALSETVRRLIETFGKEKRKKNMLDFNDLEHGCLHLLRQADGAPTELSEVIKARFDEILIDEYQDTSALQEAIFSAIKKDGGLFMVGDIKQSIYRFRNTNPLLFREKKERFSIEEDAPNRKIILSQNFRSRASVLEAINYIFYRIMSPTAGEIEYNDEEKLYPGFPYPEMEKPLSESVDICLADLEDDGSAEGSLTSAEESDENEEGAIETAEAEALMAAKKIHELLENGYQVMTGSGVRRIEYRDICILLRSTKNTADCYAKILSAQGIPCYSDVGGSFLETEEISVMLSLLKILDNPHQDIPLLAVLRSQMYALTADELAQIRMADRKSDFYTALLKRKEQEDELAEKLKEFINTLEKFREKSRQLSMSELIWYLYMQTGFYEAQSTLPGGYVRRLNLRLLYVRAASFEKTGLRGLYSFIRFVDGYASMGGDYSAARTVGEEQNVVRIMSIHKSKGLEFPVVIMGGLARKFNLQDLKKKVLIHSEKGYGPQYIDGELGFVYETQSRALVKQVLRQESYSEEERILYVALTRAREKLILLAAGRNLYKRLEKMAMVPVCGNIPGNLVLEGSSYLDWMFMALISHPDASFLRKQADFSVAEDKSSYGRFAIENIDVSALVAEKEEEELWTERSDRADSALLSLLELRYPYEKETNLPIKISVTELKRKFNGEEDAVYLYHKPEFVKARPGEMQAAEIGTAMHTFMEHLDFARADSRENLIQQRDELVLCGILTNEEADAISIDSVYAFMNSAIGKALRQAKCVKREVSFAYREDGEKIYQISGQVMVQGIIDCLLIEEDGITVIDYKTDKVHDEAAIIERYRVQLDCYRKAAELMYHKPVKHTYLYLFTVDKPLEI